MPATGFLVVKRARKMLPDGDAEIEFEFELRVGRQTTCLLARPVSESDQAWKTWGSWETSADDPVGWGEWEAQQRHMVIGWQPVPRPPLTTTDAVALGALVAGARRSVRVTRDDGVSVVTGTARHIVTDERTAAFPGDRDDVRDCLLRVTLATGFEAFWPVADLVHEYLSGLFVIHES